MPRDKELDNLIKTIEKNHKDLLTKYNVLVKRTNSIITGLNLANEKLDFLVETMGMFELIEEDHIGEDFDPYSHQPEEYEEDDDDEEDGRGYD